ncbi:uncharacterized protein K452DRAFT_336168 [Aplosporella prunicola CBS 121167]|uniref:Uncharacterized protein n=1 Tax=Aplosporella prunicola CBS 121167 TaxID=1176127 RepID=A0A6A6B680_9PEZI|nr:uncharacterized protein K452DRAFT_336168 [Aplosporella prunicola CBS 121167]KAF2139520.1 hypothetical protein K452DRAFT_336168 [Aplosporella prunicola CBS 121167]
MSQQQIDPTQIKQEEHVGGEAVQTEAPHDAELNRLRAENEQLRRSLEQDQQARAEAEAAKERAEAALKEPELIHSQAIKDLQQQLEREQQARAEAESAIVALEGACGHLESQATQMFERTNNEASEALKMVRTYKDTCDTWAAMYNKLDSDFEKLVEAYKNLDLDHKRLKAGVKAGVEGIKKVMDDYAK